MTLEQIAKTHFPAQAKRFETILRESTPRGRLVLHDFVTRQRVEFTVDGNPIVHAAKDFALSDLCYIRRDLEEELGFLPNSIDAAINPRITPDAYAIFGLETPNAHTLFIAPKDRQADLERIPELHRLDDFPTYRLFADRRDDIDPITRLFSRTCLERRARHIYQTDSQDSFLVVATDMDHFKRINKDFGAHMGDKALYIVGTEIAKSLGERGIASRRHYGDELLMLIAKSYFAEIDGGAQGWLHAVNSRLAKRSTEIGPNVTLKVTAGIFDPSLGGTWNQAKIRADQALVYARTRQEPLSLWTPTTPTLDQMQSGRYTRHKDPSVAEVQTQLSRAFPGGITKDQADAMQDILHEYVSKSEPIRKEGNRTVLERLQAHLRIINPKDTQPLDTARVWQAIYQARRNLNALTPEEITLPPDQVEPYLSQRYNLEHLLEGPDSEEYNQALDAYGICRYDNMIRTITATTQSQALSRWIVTKRDTPTTGEIRSLAELLTILNVPILYTGNGLLTLKNGKHATTIAYHEEQLDVAPALKDLASRANRAINHLGLEGVMAAQTDTTEQTPHYNLTTQDITRLEPVFAYADTQAPTETTGTIKLYSLGDEIGATIPHAHELLSERATLDPQYLARLLPENTNTNGKHPRVQIPREKAVELILQHYPNVRARKQLPTMPLFRGTPEVIATLLADLYVARNIYLRQQGGEFQIRNLSLPDVTAEQPAMDDAYLYYARQFHKLLRSGSITYDIQRAAPLLQHEPQYAALPQFTLAVSHKYEETFGGQF